MLGWNRDLTREEYVRRVADGTLGDVLRYVPARPGDVFYLPSGTLHAIGPGIILYETQQTSDLTYRIFDWNRVGADGKPRRLNVDKAADVLDYHASTAGALNHLAYVLDGVPRTALIADPRFIVERIAIGPSPAHDRPRGDAADRHGARARRRRQGRRRYRHVTAAVRDLFGSRAAATCTISAADAAATVLAIAPPREADALAQRLTRAGVPRADIDSFLGQFTHAP